VEGPAVICQQVCRAVPGHTLHLTVLTGPLHSLAAAHGWHLHGVGLYCGTHTGCVLACVWPGRDRDTRCKGGGKDVHGWGLYSE
jgi:hypothetical protein